MKGSVVAVIALLAMIQLMMVDPGLAISCPQVDSYLAKCVPYLTKGGDPDPACCSGVQNLVGAVKTPQDKRDACACVKEASNRFSNLKDDAAQALPSKCGVKLDIPISKNVNCEALYGCDERRIEGDFKIPNCTWRFVCS